MVSRTTRVCKQMSSGWVFTAMPGHHGPGSGVQLHGVGPWHSCTVGKGFTQHRLMLLGKHMHS